jgi:glucose/arabinose dehydrogenase
LVATPFLDLTSSVQFGGEQGLLGLAFHPRFRDNGFFFVNYTRRSDGATVIARYRVSASDPIARIRIGRAIDRFRPTLRESQRRRTQVRRRRLSLCGDWRWRLRQRSGNRAQNTFEWLGKLLRIDVDRGATYAIPPDNPFANGVAGRPEVWAYGLRNPWRIAFDRQTGDLYIADVGQDMVEEVDFVPVGTGAGTNFGWRVMEGSRCTGLGGGPTCGAPTLALPVAEYTHDFGCSIIGGTVYRARRSRPCSDVTSTAIFAAEPCGASRAMGWAHGRCARSSPPDSQSRRSAKTRPGSCTWPARTTAPSIESLPE